MFYSDPNEIWFRLLDFVKMVTDLKTAVNSNILSHFCMVLNEDVEVMRFVRLMQEQCEGRPKVSCGSLQPGSVITKYIYGCEGLSVWVVNKVD